MLTDAVDALGGVADELGGVAVGLGGVVAVGLGGGVTDALRGGVTAGLGAGVAAGLGGGVTVGLGGGVTVGLGGGVTDALGGVGLFCSGAVVGPSAISDAAFSSNVSRSGSVVLVDEVSSVLLRAPGLLLSGAVFVGFLRGVLVPAPAPALGGFSVLLAGASASSM